MSILDPDIPDKDAHAVATASMDLPGGKGVRNKVESSPAAVPQEAGASEVTVRSLADNNLKLCGVCKEKEAKYKCSRCYLPYCSVTCSTLHKATHPAIEPTPVVQPQEDAPKRNTAVPRPGTVAAAGFKGPFAVLDDSRELQALFRQFPRLPSQLNEINAATLRPIEVPGKSHFGRGKEEPWNQDRGLQNGVHALCQAREAYGKDGEGVREFGRLVLQLLSRDEAMDAAELIEKELAEENAMIIQQLLNREI